MYNYAKKNLKRIPLDVQKEKYEEIKAAATAAGESVNGYIKKAVDQRMDRDNA
jgi:predicted HicB family RNase H-like nuclease